MQVKFQELNAINENIDMLYHKAALRLGLTDAQMTILYILYENGGSCSQSAIYKSTGVSRSTINTAIKGMEREGVVHLEATDGRSTSVCLTEEGEALVHKTVLRIIAIENRIYDSWGEEERELVIRLNRDFMEKFALEMEEL